MEEEHIDWQTALDAVDGRRDLLGELLEIFFVEYPALLANIRKAIEIQDAEKLKLFAHRLKGCLRYFGDNHAGTLAWELERQGAAGALGEAASKYAELEQAIDRLLPAMRKFDS